MIEDRDVVATEDARFYPKKDALPAYGPPQFCTAPDHAGMALDELAHDLLGERNPVGNPLRISKQEAQLTKWDAPDRTQR